MIILLVLHNKLTNEPGKLTNEIGMTILLVNKLTILE